MEGRPARKHAGEQGRDKMAKKALPAVEWPFQERLGTSVRAGFSLPLCLQRRELLRDDMLQKIEAEEENLKKQKSGTHEKTVFSREKNLRGRMPGRGQAATWVNPLQDSSPVLGTLLDNPVYKRYVWYRGLSRPGKSTWLGKGWKGSCFCPGNARR